MIEPISWTLLLEGVKTGHSVLNENKRADLAKRFKLLCRRNRKIVVFGISGSGKSQFINSLKNNLAIPDRTFTSERTKLEIEDFPVVFIDTPGHTGSAHERREQLSKIIKDGVEGIINVTSNGHEENPTADLNNIFTSNGEIKESFIKQNRIQEIERLPEWLSMITPKNVNWIVNLVNKADLWWHDFDNVNEYYASGTYFEAFKAIDNFTNVFTLPYCSIIKPYFGTRTSGKFGDIEKMHLQNILLHQLHNLIKAD